MVQTHWGHPSKIAMPIAMPILERTQCWSCLWKDLQKSFISSISSSSSYIVLCFWEVFRMLVFPKTLGIAFWNIGLWNRDLHLALRSKLDKMIQAPLTSTEISTWTPSIIFYLILYLWGFRFDPDLDRGDIVDPPKCCFNFVQTNIVIGQFLSNDLIQAMQ